MESDNDDEDLRRAIAISLQDEKGSTVQQAILLEDDDKSPSKPAAGCAPLNGVGLLGLDRKKMEQERLARKRKASPTLSDDPVKVPKPSFDGTEQLKSGGNPSFLQGVIKRTWAMGHPKDADVITLDEVLDKDDLQLAVLNSFQWDIPWLFAKMNLSNTRITLVMQAKDDATREQYRQETSYLPNIRICFPNMEGQINCMHSKLMLLAHPKYLRIAIPTANLVSYDWGETGTMENMCFIIDLPRLPEGQRADTLTPFGEEMLYFLRAQGLEKSIVDSLNRFDFSATTNLAFVYTIGGVHTGNHEPWQRTGYPGLGRAINTLGLATQDNLDIDFIASSIGSLNTDFLSCIYLACQGSDGKAAYDAKYAPKAKHPQAANPAISDDHIKQHFRIYFPTHDTVRSSTAGSAGTICFQSKWYDAPTFPRAIMRDCKSVRRGLLMHNKLIFVRPSSSSGGGRKGAWVYVGSANCSESAWGKVSRDRVSKGLKLNCRNWECGVVFPVRVGGGDGGQRENGRKLSLSDTFDGVISVPMEYPGAEYGAKKPWFFTEN